MARANGPPSRWARMITPSHNPGRFPHLSTLTEMIFPQYCLSDAVLGSPAVPNDAKPMVSDIQAISSATALQLGIPSLRHLSLHPSDQRPTVSSRQPHSGLCVASTLAHYHICPRHDGWGKGQPKG